MSYHGKTVPNGPSPGWVKGDNFGNMLSRKDNDPISTFSFSLDNVCHFVNLTQICRELGHYKM